MPAPCLPPCDPESLPEHLLVLSQAVAWPSRLSVPSITHPPHPPLGALTAAVFGNPSQQWGCSPGPLIVGGQRPPFLLGGMSGEQPVQILDHVMRPSVGPHPGASDRLGAPNQTPGPRPPETLELEVTGKPVWPVLPARPWGPFLVAPAQAGPVGHLLSGPQALRPRNPAPPPPRNKTQRTSKSGK